MEARGDRETSNKKPPQRAADCSVPRGTSHDRLGRFQAGTAVLACNCPASIFTAAGTASGAQDIQHADNEGHCMVQSKAKSVADYLKELPPERRKVVAAERKGIKSKLPAGYEEAMNWGMISYQ